ncbi:hypothetical protein QE152_g38152 [Popillia japonica]|uniref:Transposable element P transposase-like RNase H domain-containing protein n=1 Tax=Popillia japonica TaxID=7064 RepID=A0AAW1I8T3_POPJA
MNQRHSSQQRISTTDAKCEESALRWLEEIETDNSDIELDCTENVAEKSDHDSESEVEDENSNNIESEDEDCERRSNYYYGRNCFKWSKAPATSNRGRRPQHNIVLQLPGLRSAAKNIGDSPDFAFSLATAKTFKKIENAVDPIVYEFIESQIRSCRKFSRGRRFTINDKPGMHYNKSRDILEGFVTYGEESTCRLADHALVFMAQGIYKKWKQPIAFMFCEGSTDTANLVCQIKKVIRDIFSCGLKPVATVCDQGASNRAAIKHLVDETKLQYSRSNKPYTIFGFEVDGKEIVPLFDYPHLMKCIRNNLLTKDLVYSYKGIERRASWQHIINLYNWDTPTNILELLKLKRNKRQVIQKNGYRQMEAFKPFLNFAKTTSNVNDVYSQESTEMNNMKLSESVQMFQSSEPEQINSSQNLLKIQSINPQTPKTDISQVQLPVLTPTSRAVQTPGILKASRKCNSEPSTRQIEAKMKIAQVIMEQELLHLEESSLHSHSRPTSTDTYPNISSVESNSGAFLGFPNAAAFPRQLETSDYYNTSEKSYTALTTAGWDKWTRPTGRGQLGAAN